MKEKVINGQTFLPVEHDFRRYNHMLRLADRETVPTVMRYLDGQGMDVYLGGDVTSRWLRFGQRDYSHVNLWAVARNEGDRERLIQELLSAAVSLTDKTTPMAIGEMDFKVKYWWTCKESARKMNERNHIFTLTPEQTLAERMLFIRAASMNISIAPRERFDSVERD